MDFTTLIQINSGVMYGKQGIYIIWYFDFYETTCIKYTGTYLHLHYRMIINNVIVFK